MEFKITVHGNLLDGATGRIITHHSVREMWDMVCCVFLEQALIETYGRQTKAAAVLGVSHTTAKLWYKTLPEETKAKLAHDCFPKMPYHTGKIEKGKMKKEIGLPIGIA